VPKTRASAEKFPGRGAMKKDRKIALLSLFWGGGNGKKDQKIAKTSKNSIF